MPHGTARKADRAESKGSSAWPRRSSCQKIEANAQNIPVRGRSDPRITSLGTVQTDCTLQNPRSQKSSGSETHGQPLLTYPVPSYFAHSGLKNDNMPQNYARNAFFAEETEYRLPETTIKSSGPANSLALSRASSKLCASTIGTSARPQAAHF